MNDKYLWNYCSLGGRVRVNIVSGDDIAHLCELDQKMWTVLSCPVEGLEFDRRTLDYLDTDHDGKIRVPEVIAASKWLCACVRDKDLITNGLSTIALSDIDEGSSAGKRLLDGSERILANLGSDHKEITLAEASDSVAFFAKTRFNGDGVITPASTDDEALKALIATIASAAGSVPDRSGVHGIDAERILAFYGACADFVAWCSSAEDAWLSPTPEVAESDAYKAWIEAKKGIIVEGLGLEAAADFLGTDRKAELMDLIAKDLAEADSAASMLEVAKFMCIYRDFYELLRNYVNFSDFYGRESGSRANFEAGRLFLDERCCEVCVKVSDMSQHAEMAKLSGMFLLYCKCVSKVRNAAMDIVAVMTDGNTRELRPGKNGIFYDRAGQDWDATIVKVVDNPISIKQAFWSPYRKFADFCTGLVNKSAADKEAKTTADLQAKAVPGAAASPARRPFDIATFAGIFAAIGMALGFLGQFLTDLVRGVVNTPAWKVLVIIAVIMLVISAPSCFIAWSKLRRRNLGPVLNANGWAINSMVLINIVFGKLLTSTARYPAFKGKDPYARKTPLWRKLLLWLLALAVAVMGVLFACGVFRHKEVPETTVPLASTEQVKTLQDSSAVIH